MQPLYLAAERSQLPELKRVIVSFGNALAMEENLELSLQQLFGGEVTREREAPKTAQTKIAERADRQMARQALTYYRRGQELIRQGNWAGYGEEMKKLEKALRALEKRK